MSAHSDFEQARTVPNVMNASSMAYVPFLMRMNVLNDTAIMERTKKTQDIAMIARGKPSGAISLAVGSSLTGGRDMAKIDQDKERTGERTGEPSAVYDRCPSPTL